MLIVRTSARFLLEKQYVFDVLLGESLGVPFRVETSDEPDFHLVLPNGKCVTLRDGFFSKITGDSYLSSANIPADVPTVEHPFEPSEKLTVIYGEPVLYFRDDEIITSLDLFASAFFMLTRWEERVLPDRDRHGRFPASASLSVKYNFLERPIVDEYAALLWQLLVRMGWQGERKKQAFRLQPSHDVDYPKLWWRPADRLRTLAASIFRRGDWREAGYFLRQKFSTENDPFDTFDLLMDLSERNGLRSQFNFMGERPPDSDAFYPLRHPFVQDLMQKIAQRGHEIGFHPSYESFGDAGKFRSELASLACPPRPLKEESSPAKPKTAPPSGGGGGITSGRQHFLRFSVPETWQTWADACLKTDGTLGYPEAEGFRCGTCHDFPAFNILTRQKLTLREQPLVAMDVTLAQYRKYTPETALEKLRQLVGEVRKHGGTFTLLWHNSSWNTYFWRPFQVVYETFLHENRT